MADCAGKGFTSQSLATVIEETFTALPASARILDAGCGQGVPLLWRSNQSFTGIGLDIAPGQLRRAQMNVPIAPLVHGDMRTLPFREGTFDVITASHSITHVPDSHHRTVFAEFARVLRPGGKLLLLTNTSTWTDPLGDQSGSIDKTRKRLVTAGFAVSDEGITRAAPTSGETAAVHFLHADYAD